jgi:hypothetical protein
VNKCNNWLFIVLIFLFDWDNCHKEEDMDIKKAHPDCQDGLEYVDVKQDSNRISDLSLPDRWSGWSWHLLSDE